MSEEKMKILEMIEKGMVSAEEGATLLDSVDTHDRVTPIKKGPFKMFKVRVLSKDGDKVNIQVPLSLAKIALSTGKGINFNGKINGVDFEQLGLDLETILDMIDEGNIGKLVDIESADGDIVEVYVE
ncbi:hypothetical protein KHQ82_08870 [Mycoplasmatota bacterium]|nr:hypothetical protein KHQ82_08870 [Mycoplasmatota bacterium]